MIADEQTLYEEHTSTLSHIVFIVVLELAVLYHRLQYWLRID